MAPNGRAELTRILQDDLDLPANPPAPTSEESVTVIVLRGGMVLYNRTHKNVEISQTRTVTPVYRTGYLGTIDSHVEPGSEKTVITLKGA